MPMYFMHIHGQDGVTKDDEGAEYLDIEAAHREALFTGKLLVGEFLKGGGSLHDALNRKFEITDSKGEVLITVPFAEGADADLRDVALGKSDGT